MFVDWRKVILKKPDGTEVRGRFIFQNGTVAIWEEDRRARTATRLFFSQNAELSKSRNGRIPHTLTVDGEDYAVRQIRGAGSCCGSPTSPAKLPPSVALHPDVSTVSAMPKARG